VWKLANCFQTTININSWEFNHLVILIVLIYRTGLTCKTSALVSYCSLCRHCSAAQLTKQEITFISIPGFRKESWEQLPHLDASTTTTAMSASHSLSSAVFFLLLCASHIRAKNAVIDILTQQWMMLGTSAAYCLSNEKITIHQYFPAG
jgi:hypothetical protein